MGIPILKVYDADGNQIPIPAIKGDPGAKGDKGDTGDTGPAGAQGPQGQQGAAGTPGAAAGFGTPTATVDANVGTPSVAVSATGADTAKVFSFAFHNLKGPQGQQGVPGTNGTNGEDGVGIASITFKQTTSAGNVYTVTLTNGTTYDITAPKGAQGEQGQQGQQGAQGVPGADGTDGVDGEDGKSAYEAAQDGGYTGTEAQFNTDLAAVSGKYSKPSSGIPKTDLASAVQTSLGLADTALQTHQSLAAYRTAAAQNTIDAGKLNVSQGVAHAGKFMVVGTDGNIVPQAFSVLEGGSY